ncbi:MAG: hypothetical protein LKG88_08540, partial [Acetobacter sp.]|nr:hypothetical protein [Acetobacter sp.]
MSYLILISCVATPLYWLRTQEISTFVIIRRETRAYSGGDGIVDLLVGFPVPGQEFMEAWIGDVID